MIVEFIVTSCLALLLILGLIVGKKNQQEAQTFTDFFIGKRNFSTLIILSTIFAGMVTGSSIISIVAAFFSKGYFYLIPCIAIFIAHLWTGLWVAKKMGPYLENSLSPGDILEKMYGREAKIIMGFTGLLESILILTVQIMVVCFICHYFFNIPHIFSAFGALLFTLIYCLRGGIKALVMSNIIQFTFFIIILPLLCCILLSSLGAFKDLVSALSNTSHPQPPILNLYKSLSKFIYHALPALFPLALQRMLMAKNIHQIKKSFIGTALINFIFFICMMIVGLYARIIIPQVEPKLALLSIIDTISPIGKGLIIFGLLATLMSTITSYLNVACIAITQDLFIPLFKKELNEVEKLKIAKFAVLGIGIGAACLALYGSTIFSIAYFIVFINSSVMLVLYMLGFLNFKPSKKALLSSISISIIFLFIAFFIFDMYKFYAGLIAIAITGTSLFISHYLNKTSFSKSYGDQKHKKKKFKLFELSVKRIEHCNVFATIAIINSVYPFFLMIPTFNLVSMPFFFIYPLTSLFSFLILFKEIWPSNLFKYFPLVWHILITLSLPTLAFLMYFQSNYHSIWLLDIGIIIVLLLITTKPNMALITGVIGALLAVFITTLVGINFSEYVIRIGEICLIVHLISAIICLLFFKEQENDMYRSVSSKITHEAARSLSGVGVSAFFLEERISTLIYGYKLACTHNLISSNLLPDEELQQLKELPFNLNGMGERASNTLHSLLHKMDKKLNSERQLETVDIISLAKEAILDPSFSFEQRKKIVINTYHNFFIAVMPSEIVHVLINLVENAFNAIKDKPDGKIEIWASDLSLFIKDNGIGIGRNILFQIFDEGFSTKGTSGQGLAFCKKVMEEHAGKIRCTSKQGVYTQFELIFNDNK